MSAPSASTARPVEGGTAGAWGYRPHLDGLRTLSIVLVVLFHAGVPAAANGFVGVDVFFVLSGYLVTGVLLAHRAHHGGGIDLATFYARRVRRLLPAALVVLVAVLLLHPAIAGSATSAQLGDAVRAASLWHVNFLLIGRDTGWIEVSPVGHFWSLAVEEHFYVLWPLALLLALRAGERIGGRVGGRPRRTTGLIVGGVGLLSLALALSLASGEPRAAYYHSAARAYQLLAGAVLAIAPGAVELIRGLPTRWPVTALGAGAITAVALLALDVVAMAATSRSLLVTLATVTAIAAYEASPTDAGARLLATRPLVSLGRLSYGIYLWHWVLIVWIAHLSSTRAPVALAVVVFGASTALAAAMSVVERRIQALPIPPGRAVAVVAAGIAASAFVGLGGPLLLG